MLEVIIPPTMGAAIGFITSEPIPVPQRIGIRLARTAITVSRATSGEGPCLMSLTLSRTATGRINQIGRSSRAPYT